MDEWLVKEVLVGKDVLAHIGLYPQTWKLLELMYRVVRKSPWDFMTSLYEADGLKALNYVFLETSDKERREGCLQAIWCRLMDAELDRITRMLATPPAPSVNPAKASGSVGGIVAP